MVPRRYIEEWKEYTPWSENAQVEQDLVIEKTMLRLFSDPYLQEHLALEAEQPCIKYFSNLRCVILKILTWCK